MALCRGFQTHFENLLKYLKCLSLRLFLSDTATASKTTSQSFDKKNLRAVRLLLKYFQHSELFFQGRDSSIPVFIQSVCFGSHFVSKGSAFNIKPNPLYSSFILVFSLNDRVGNGLSFIVSSC